MSGISCNRNPSSSIKLRLLWTPQAQFAGYIVAQKKGFYSNHGLTVEILSAGPDLKPQVTVANGTDDIGIGVPNSIIAARTNGVPLVALAQMFQDSPNRYVLKRENQISSLRDLKGKKVGLWTGGDEAEFVSMLKTANMELSDIEVVPQGFSITPFLEDQYVLSMVTTYNELPQIINAGFNEESLQILSPKEYNSAIPGDMIFCRSDFLKQNQEIVFAFLEASFEGWKYCYDNQAESVEIVMESNPELKKDEQVNMLTACLNLIKSGDAITNGMGYISEDSYSNVQRIIFESKQIDRTTDVKTVVDKSVWDKIPASQKRF
jgi:NitT/TauT family transport system substrate-binding protein